MPITFSEFCVSGISLKIDEWNKFKEQIDEIDDVVQDLFELLVELH
jgi:hypothetical protein